jgi:hypothetical protein
VAQRKVVWANKIVVTTVKFAENIYVVFGDQVFQQSVGIPMDTNCVPLLADLFLYSYEADIVQKLLRDNNKKLTMSFNHAFRYIDDVLSITNNNFHNNAHLIYHDELERAPQNLTNLLNI